MERRKKHDIFLVYNMLGGLNGSKTTFVVGSERFDPVTVIEAIDAALRKRAKVRRRFLAVVSACVLTTVYFRWKHPRGF